MNSKIEDVNSKIEDVKAEIKAEVDAAVAIVKDPAAAAKETALAEMAETSTLLQSGTSELAASLEEAESLLNLAESELVLAESELVDKREETRPKRGRPAGHKGAEELAALWDDMTINARRQAVWRHTEEIKENIQEAGLSNWLPGSRMNTMSLPLGDHSGRESMPPDSVMRRALPESRSISHSQPLAETTICSPSGEGAGSIGPAFSIGSS